MSARRLAVIAADIVACRACPRLVEWREHVAEVKRRAYAAETYWGRPVPGFGDPAARIVLVGLAPGAHGANRTGRMFTGDRSGDFLFAALHRAGLASQPTSTSRDDGLTLRDVFIVAPGRCAPPDNHPTREELERCQPFLDAELTALRRRRVIVALGGIAHAAFLAHAARVGRPVAGPRPRFAHGAEHEVAGLTLIDCFHPSQQNTQTGRLTPAMQDAVFARAKAAVDSTRG
ncbi:MAG: uracil-DNA glycosylase [Polyangiaceae bacterium]|nr:uracil-DNA glycosylase [Polyangiaceae bacterium]